MLNSGEKKRNILTLVLSEKKILNETKNHNYYCSKYGGPGWLNELGSWIIYYSYKPITNMAWVRARFCKLQKGCS